MTKISDISADNQSEARISVAFNKNCHLSLITNFVKKRNWEPQNFDGKISLILYNDVNRDVI